MTEDPRLGQNETSEQPEPSESGSEEEFPYPQPQMEEIARGNPPEEDRRDG
jgi:hypothetical protein